MMKSCVFSLVAVFLLLMSTLYADTIQDIESAILDKRFEDARHLAYDFVQESSDPTLKAQAQYYLGISQLKLGNYNYARKVFKDLIYSRPVKDLEDRATLGLIDGFYMDGQYQEALTQAEGLLKNTPHSDYRSAIYLKIARANLKLAKWQKAQKMLEKITHEFPDSLEIPAAQQLLNEKQFFTVQVGAYKEEAAAQKLIEDLKVKGEYAYIVETTPKEGNKVFRVRVGQLAALTDAKKLEAKLAGLGYPTLIYP